MRPPPALLLRPDQGDSRGRVADTDLTNRSCGRGPGSFGHYTIDAQTIAHDWDADYLKVRPHPLLTLEFAIRPHPSLLFRRVASSC